MLIGFGWWIHIWDGDFQGLTLCLGRTAVHGSRTPEGDFLGFSKSNGLSQGSSGWWFQTFCFFSIIYGMSSFPLTNSIIFQDGYCTTNQYNIGINNHKYGGLI